MTWNGLTLAETAATGGITFTPTVASTTSLTTVLNFFPINAGELARYEFTITATSAFGVGHSIFIWFPSNYPSNLGNPICEIRPAAGVGSVSATCSTGVNRPWIRIDNDKVAVAAGTAFEAIINNVYNPKALGTSGEFHVSILSGDSIVDMKTASLTATIDLIPALLPVVDITTSTNNKQEPVSYHFNIRPANTIAASKSEVWIRFPEYDYNWELIGYGNVHTCDASSSDGTTVTPWYTPTCTNSYKNIIVAGGENPNYSVSPHTLTVTVNNVMTPTSYTPLKNFEIAIYDNVAKKFIERSHGTASSDDILTF